MGRSSLAVLAGAAFLLVSAPAASAHAQLTNSIPASGQLLKSAPKVIEFDFGEDVEAQFGAVSLFGPTGSKIEVGSVSHPNGRGNRISVTVTGSGQMGAWTAVYRVVSADGHPVAGGVVFNVGKRGSAAKSVAALTAPTETPKAVDVAMGLARILGFVALILGLGTVLMFVLVLRATNSVTSSEVRLLVRMVRAGALLGVVAAGLGVCAQTAIAGATDLGGAIDADALGATLGTRYGQVSLLAVLAWLVVVACAHAAVGQERIFAVVPMSAALALVASVPALAGHAATQQPIGVFAPLNVLHVIAMSFWAGGVVVLLLLTRKVGQGERERLLLARSAFTKFSALALWAVAIVVATGVGQSLVNISSISELATTPYGRAVLVKLVLTVALIAVGAWQRKRGLPRIKSNPNEARLSIRRALAGEVALFTAVLSATAALASYPPASASQKPGPISRTSTSSGMQIQMTVDPAAVGINQVHLYLLNANSGAQFTSAKEVTVSETLKSKAIGPLTQQATKAGAGHWIVTSASLPVRGEWEVRIVVRLSEFVQVEQTFSVPVR